MFLTDENNSAFEAYDTFERLYQKAKNFKLELLDGVLAYRLLRSANLSDTHVQLARAMLLSLTYNNMQLQLKKIFSDGSAQSSSLASVKIEPTYESGHQEVEAYYTHRGHARNVQCGRGRWGGRARKSDSSSTVAQYNDSDSHAQEQRNSGTKPKRHLALKSRKSLHKDPI